MERMKLINGVGHEIEHDTLLHVICNWLFWRYAMLVENNNNSNVVLISVGNPTLWLAQILRYS